MVIIMDLLSSESAFSDWEQGHAHGHKAVMNTRRHMLKENHGNSIIVTDVQSVEYIFRKRII